MSNSTMKILRALERVAYKVHRLLALLEDPRSLALLWKGCDPDLYLVLKKSNLLDKFNINTVIDIGAYKGKFSYVLHTLKPDVSIIAFEPLKELYEICLQNYSFFDKIFNVALSDKEGEFDIFITKRRHSSSLLRPTDVGVKTFGEKLMCERVEKVIVQRLDDLLSPDDLRKEILIKIDVQGHEASVIRGGRNIVKDARLLIVEVSFDKFYYGQDRFSQIYDELYSLGFEYRGPLQSFRNDMGLVIFEDALFVRE